MATSENETVADIVKRVRRDCNSYPLPTAAAEMLKLVREMDAAHQREVAELRECLREAVTEVCNRLEKCGFKEPCVFKTCYVQKWRKALQDKGGAE